MGSRLRANPDNIFELFAEVIREQDSEPVITLKYPEQSTDEELLATLGRFAFPVASDFKSTSVDHFAFVLTDIRGQFRFGFCRHFPGSARCLCIVSYFPWFEIFYRFLNHVAELFNRCDEVVVFSLLAALHTHDVPQQGMFVEVSTSGRQSEGFSFTCPPYEELPSIPESRNLTEYCNAVSLRNMVSLFASMLCERRVIVTSKRLSRLTSCIHASCSLIYPMNWQHLYIPAMPSHLLEYCSAPMPYIIGVHSSLMEQARDHDLGDVVVLDADEDCITSPYDDMRSLPPEVLYQLKKSLKISPTGKALNAILLGDGLSRAFLSAMVFLLGGYRDALRFRPDEPVEFNVEMFIASRPATMRPFLLTLLSLQAFEQFIADRLEMLNSDHGFKGLFESEANGYVDKLDAQKRYREWIKKKGKQLKHESKEIWGEMKVKSKKKMKDIRTCIDDLKKEEQKRAHGSQQHRSITISNPPIRPLRPLRPPALNMAELLGPSPLPRQLALRRGTYDSVIPARQLATGGGHDLRSQTLLQGGVAGPAVERFHSVRLYGSFDEASLMKSSDSGLDEYGSANDTDLYVNWSRPRRLSDVQDLTPSEEEKLLHLGSQDDSSLLVKGSRTSQQLTASADDLLTLHPIEAQLLPSTSVPSSLPRNSSRRNVRKVSCSRGHSITARRSQLTELNVRSGLQTTNNGELDSGCHLNESSNLSLPEELPRGGEQTPEAERDSDAEPESPIVRRVINLPRSGSGITRQKAFYKNLRPLAVKRRPSQANDDDAVDSVADRVECISVDSVAADEVVETVECIPDNSRCYDADPNWIMEADAAENSCGFPACGSPLVDPGTDGDTKPWSILSTPDSVNDGIVGVYGPIGFRTSSRNSVKQSRISFKLDANGDAILARSPSNAV